MSESVPEALDEHRDEFDSGAEQITVDYSDAVDDTQEFKSVAIPFSVGFAGDTHGLTEIDYLEKTLTFEKIDK